MRAGSPLLLVAALILSGCKPAAATAEDKAEAGKAFPPEVALPSALMLAGRVTDAPISSNLSRSNPSPAFLPTSKHARSIKWSS